MNLGIYDTPHDNSALLTTPMEDVVQHDTPPRARTNSFLDLLARSHHRRMLRKVLKMTEVLDVPRLRR